MTVRSVLQLATQDRLQDGGARTLHGHIQQRSANCRDVNEQFCHILCVCDMRITHANERETIPKRSGFLHRAHTTAYTPTRSHQPTKSSSTVFSSNCRPPWHRAL